MLLLLIVVVVWVTNCGEIYYRAVITIFTVCKIEYVVTSKIVIFIPIALFLFIASACSRKQNVCLYFDWNKHLTCCFRKLAENFHGYRFFNIYLISKSNKLIITSKLLNFMNDFNINKATFFQQSLHALFYLQYYYYVVIHTYVYFLFSMIHIVIYLSIWIIKLNCI